MKVKLLLICLIILCSCNRDINSCDNCKTMIGKLLFEVNKIEWGEVCIGKDYENIVRVYNPTHKDISMKIFTRLPELCVVKFGSDSLDCASKEVVLSALACDTLRFIFMPRDTSLIGDYSKGIFLEIDGEVYMKPIEMRAEVLENFDSLTSKELLSAPTIDVEKDTFSFGTITVNEKVTIPVKITNKGKRNLIIRKVESDCTCTAAIIGNRIVGINDSVILKIVFRPMGRYGRQYKTIRLYCNDPHRPVIKLIIHGDVAVN